MSEPSSGVPSEIADADVEEPSTEAESDAPDTVELEVDEEKVEAWDEVKGDYQVEPGGQPVPNSMDHGDVGTSERTAAEVEREPEVIPEGDDDTA
jgi:hypothetical protein